jgi:hypothetical protein
MVRVGPQTKEVPMRRLERMQLVEAIATELQSRMVTSDINEFLSSCGIDLSDRYQDSVRSKRIYVKNILSGEADSMVLAIADELELPDAFKGKNSKPEDATFWIHGHFRLFLTRKIHGGLADVAQAFEMA